MTNGDIVRISLRLNLRNEQHSRIYKVLTALDKSVHKSENQFIVKAIDFYIQSFEDDAIINEIQQKKRNITAKDLEDIRKEIESDLKDELIRLLGSIITGSLIPRGQENGLEPVQGKETEKTDLYAMEAANRWG